MKRFNDAAGPNCKSSSWEVATWIDREHTCPGDAYTIAANEELAHKTAKFYRSRYRYVTIRGPLCGCGRCNKEKNK